VTATELGDLGDDVDGRSADETSPQRLRGGVDDGVDLVAGLGAGLHRAAPGNAQQADRFHGPDLRLRGADGFTGEHGAGSTDGVGLVGLSVAATMLPVRAHHLTHVDALGGEVTRQSGTPRTGPLDTHRDDVAVSAHPAPQLPIAGGRGWERPCVQQSAVVVEHGTDVDVLVRVDPADHAPRIRWWVCHPGHRHPFVLVVDGTHSRSRTGQ